VGLVEKDEYCRLLRLFVRIFIMEKSIFYGLASFDCNLLRAFHNKILKLSINLEEASHTLLRGDTIM